MVAHSTKEIRPLLKTPLKRRLGQNSTSTAIVFRSKSESGDLPKKLLKSRKSLKSAKSTKLLKLANLTKFIICSTPVVNNFLGQPRIRANTGKTRPPSIGVYARVGLLSGGTKKTFGVPSLRAPPFGATVKTKNDSREPVWRVEWRTLSEGRAGEKPGPVMRCGGLTRP